MTQVGALEVFRPFLWVAALGFVTGFSGYMILHGVGL